MTETDRRETSETPKTSETPEICEICEICKSETRDTCQMRETVALLHAERCSCVVRNGSEVRIFRERGVKDLYRLLREEPALLRGAFVADKVIGKAAAALMILAGVREVYTDVASRPAVELFRAAGVPVTCAAEVPHIINRTRTDWCPLEKRCFACKNPEECLTQIEEFLASIG